MKIRTVFNRSFAVICLVGALAIMLTFAACKSEDGNKKTADKSFDKPSNDTSSSVDMDDIDDSDAIFLPEVP